MKQYEVIPINRKLPRNKQPDSVFVRASDSINARLAGMNWLKVLRVKFDTVYVREFNPLDDLYLTSLGYVRAL